MTIYDFNDHGKHTTTTAHTPAIKRPLGFTKREANQGEPAKPITEAELQAEKRAHADPLGR